MTTTPNVDDRPRRSAIAAPPFWLGTATEGSWWGLAGALGATVGLWLVAGPVGGVTGIALIGVWLLIPALYAYVLGQLVVLAVVPPSVSVAPLILIEAGLLWILLSPAIGWPDPWRTIGYTSIGGGILAGVVFLVIDASGALWVGGLLLIAIIIALTDEVHRYGMSWLTRGGNTDE